MLKNNNEESHIIQRKHDLRKSTKYMYYIIEIPSKL